MFFSGVGAPSDRAAAQFSRTAGRISKRRSISDLRDVYDGGKKSVSLQIEDLCPRCRGTGTERGRLCPQCHGTGHVLLSKKFEVTIPKGIGEGQRIRLAGKAAPASTAARTATSTWS